MANKPSKKNIFLVAFFGTLSLTILILLTILLWPDPPPEPPIVMTNVGKDNMGKDKTVKVRTPLQSFYNLDELKFFAEPGENYLTYVVLRVSLAYSLDDVDAEKAILIRRDEINAHIQRYISKKTYIELDTIDKRNQLKKDMKKYINDEIMGNSDKEVHNIYYIKFQVYKQSKNLG